MKSGAVAQAHNPHRGGAAWGGNLFVLVSLQQLQQWRLFDSVCQGWQRKKGGLADPFQEGRPAGVTSANAYTLSLWAGDEDHTLTRKRGRVNAWSQSLRDFGIFLAAFQKTAILWGSLGVVEIVGTRGRLSFIQHQSSPWWPEYFAQLVLVHFAWWLFEFAIKLNSFLKMQLKGVLVEWQHWEIPEELIGRIWGRCEKRRIMRQKRGGADSGGKD